MTPELSLRAMLESVLHQTYGNWELCLVDCPVTVPGNSKIFFHFYVLDSRFILHILPDNALRLQTIHLLQTEDALYWVVDALQRERYDVVYSDEDRMAENGSHYLEPRFKPEFDIDLLRWHIIIFPICLWHGESLCWRTEAFIVSMMVRRATI